MFRSCSISLREGTSSGHVPTPSGSWVPGASAPDMLSSRARRSSRRPEAALGGCQPRSVPGDAARWAGAGVGQPGCPRSPRAGRSPLHCHDRHSRFKQMQVPNWAFLDLYRLQSASLASPPGPHCSATRQPWCRGRQPQVAQPPARRTPTNTGCDCPQPCLRHSCGTQRDLRIHH